MSDAVAKSPTEKKKSTPTLTVAKPKAFTNWISGLRRSQPGSPSTRHGVKIFHVKPAAGRKTSNSRLVGKKKRKCKTETKHVRSAPEIGVSTLSKHRTRSPPASVVSCTTPPRTRTSPIPPFLPRSFSEAKISTLSRSPTLRHVKARAALLVPETSASKPMLTRQRSLIRTTLKAKPPATAASTIVGPPPPISPIVPTSHLLTETNRSRRSLDLEEEERMATLHDWVCESARQQIQADLAAEITDEQDDLHNVLFNIPNFTESQVRDWKPTGVASFLRIVIPLNEYQAQQFVEHEIDGVALLLVERSHLTDYMDLRLGPALKIQACVRSLKRKCRLNDN